MGLGAARLKVLQNGACREALCEEEAIVKVE